MRFNLPHLENNILKKIIITTQDSEKVRHVKNIYISFFCFNHYVIFQCIATSFIVAPHHEHVKALKAGLRLSLKYSTSDWIIGGANYAVAVVTDSKRS